MQSGPLKHKLLRGLTLAMGAERTQRLVLARNFAAYRRAGVIFVHVPKAAGSTISEALYRRSLGHFTAREMAAYDHTWFERLPSFAVLREPVERTYSAWRYVRTGGTAEGWIAPSPDYTLPEFASFERFAEEWLPPRITDPEALDFV
ncbi:MAG: sulfotransferase family 2 domain-containing protein, partial [Pseudomonadota bacterium]